MTRSYLQHAVDIASEAGALISNLFVTKIQSESKGAFDIVTEADRASEELIVRRIRSEFPSHNVVAEESGCHEACSEYRWHIDPLDGTKNFARGYPAFSLCMALERDEEVILGVVYDPVRQEMFAAELGAGAFCNDQRIRVSQVDRLEECLVATGFPSSKRHRQANLKPFYQVCMATLGLRRTGSSALDLSYIACGRLDAFWDVGLSSWDVAAGLALISEAGGCYSNPYGGSFSLANPDLLADNGLVHEALVRMLADIQMDGRTSDLGISSRTCG